MAVWTDEAVIGETRRWIETFVIGLGLCPFARRVVEADRVRYVVSHATTESALREDLGRELRNLETVPRDVVETTILIHPDVLNDYLDYNDFVASADDVLDDMGLRGVIQVAGFHPHYQFAGTEPYAVENFTNRSPFPMMHLLREVSITEVSGDEEFLAAIPERNIETLRRLGLAGVRAKLRGG